jgi:hypothetical protein
MTTESNPIDFWELNTFVETKKQNLQIDPPKIFTDKPNLGCLPDMAFRRAVILAQFDHRFYPKTIIR